MNGKTCERPDMYQHSGKQWPCGRPAKYEFEGKFYCGVHNPQGRTRKQKAERITKLIAAQPERSPLAPTRFPDSVRKPNGLSIKRGLPDLHLLSNRAEEDLELAREMRTSGTPILDAPFVLDAGAGKAAPEKVSKTLFRGR